MTLKEKISTIRSYNILNKVDLEKEFLYGIRYLKTDGLLEDICREVNEGEYKEYHSNKFIAMTNGRMMEFQKCWDFNNTEEMYKFFYNIIHNILLKYSQKYDTVGFLFYIALYPQFIVNYIYEKCKTSILIYRDTSIKYPMIKYDEKNITKIVLLNVLCGILMQYKEVMSENKENWTEYPSVNVQTNKS